MDITLKEIHSSEELHSHSLRQRASNSSKAVFTRHYAAMHDCIEIEFVAIDRHESKDYFCVYELFVDPSKRSNGYGTKIINTCRHLAQEEKFKSICLIPRPIEVDGSEEFLRSWYGKLGFSQSPADSTLMEIVFTPTTQTER